MRKGYIRRIIGGFLVASFGFISQANANEANDSTHHSSFSLEYVGEIQSDFKHTKFVNHLHLRAFLPITERLTAEIASVSAATTDEKPLKDVLQGYSNIDAENTPFALAVAGLSWQIDERHSLFAGIRRMDEDYFCTDLLSLFTNSTCGGFPTVTANYDIAAYPMAAVGVHYAYECDCFGIQASVYNGTGHNRFYGGANVFRFCPKSDGVFALAQAEYRKGESSYYLGGSLHYSDLYGSAPRRPRPVVWAYAEQTITDRFAVIAAYSHAFSTYNDCRNFCAIGGRYSLGRASLGVFSDYTRIAGADEWATEFTCNVACSKAVSLQPTLHIINTDGKTVCVALLRLGVCL